MLPMLFLGTLSPLSLFYVFAGFILLITFTTGLSLLTSALNVRFRDVNFLVQAGLIVWFYVTPIIYTLSMIPYQFYWLWRLNPMTSILQLLQHGFLGKPLPGIGMLSANTAMIISIFVLGVNVFKRESKNFDDWV